MKIGDKNIEHPYLDIFAVILVIVLIAGSWLGYRSYSAAQSRREKQAASQKAQKERLGAFRNLMESRTEFLTLNAQVDSTLNQVKSKIDANLANQENWDKEWAALQSSYSGQVEAVKAHNAEEDAKYKADPRYTNRDYWSYPSYPSPPPPIAVDFAAEINALTAQTAVLTDYIKTLGKLSGRFADVEINPLYKDLLAAAEATQTAGERDIEILGGIVISGEQGAIVNDAKADLMKYNAGDSSLKAMTKKILAFIKENDLDLDDYEVPGGVDTNPSDKSNLQ